MILGLVRAVGRGGRGTERGGEGRGSIGVCCISTHCMWTTIPSMQVRKKISMKMQQRFDIITVPR